MGFIGDTVFKFNQQLIDQGIGSLNATGGQYSYLYKDPDTGLLTFKPTATNNQVITTLYQLGLVPQDAYQWFQKWGADAGGEPGSGTQLAQIFNDSNPDITMSTEFPLVGLTSTNQSYFQDLLNKLETGRRAGGFTPSGSLENYNFSPTEGQPGSASGVARPVFIGQPPTGGTPENPYYSTSDVLVTAKEQPDLYDTFHPYIDPKIKALYQDLLGRSVDEPGMGYWRDVARSGMSIEDIRNLIMQSEEYRSRTNPPTTSTPPSTITAPPPSIGPVSGSPENPGMPVSPAQQEANRQYGQQRENPLTMEEARQAAIDAGRMEETVRNTQYTDADAARDARRQAIIDSNQRTIDAAVAAAAERGMALPPDKEVVGFSKGGVVDLQQSRMKDPVTGEGIESFLMKYKSPEAVDQERRMAALRRNLQTLARQQQQQQMMQQQQPTAQGPQPTMQQGIMPMAGPRGA